MHSRHDLVWLTPGGWDGAWRAAGPAQRDALARWRDKDWPAVVRRHEPGAGADQLCLGLPLPPDAVSGAKERIALTVACAVVARSAPPLALGAVLDTAPQLWRAPLAALDAAARGLRLHVFGSLALQAITGQPYVTARSDIDLLFHPASVDGLGAGLALLAQAATGLPLDGELVFPCGAAVAWKEWLAAGPTGAKVLVKDLGGVRLSNRAALLATLEA